jgi:integrase
MISTSFASPLGPDIRDFLTAKRALARKYVCEERGLRGFDRFVAERGVAGLLDVTPALITEFSLARRRRPAGGHARPPGFLWRFLNWLVAQGRLPVSPLPVRPRRPARALAPYIFRPDEVRAMLDAAARLPDGPRSPGRARTFRMAIALLYALGLRSGEACRLTMGDVDLARDLLVVRETKFGKSRLVPFGPRLAAELRDHLAFRATASLTPEAPLLSLDGRRPLTTGYLCLVFVDLARAIVTAVPPGVRRPHPHCMRHSFAVGTLLRWYREGVDVQSRLPQLSTFLGHVDPSSTAVYLTMTSEILEAANRRFEAYAAPSVAEVRP